MLSLLRPSTMGRWVLALCLASGYFCGGCWHDHHDDHDHHDEHWHDDHHDYDHDHDHDHY